MINKRFSLLQAYVVSIKMLLEYISFYMVWYGIVLFAWFGIVTGLGLYADLLDYKALTQNVSWVDAIFKRWLSDIKISYSSIPGDVSVYGLLRHFLPTDILNHTLEKMSWSEYFNIIIFPKKVALLSLIVAISWLSMSVSIGFIKTALSFQSNGTANFRDMYRYFYLVPSYLSTKLVMLVFCIAPLGALFFVHSYLGILKLPLLVIVIGIMVFVYQRLRFAKYFVIDQEKNPIDACKASWHLTQGSVFHLLIFSICAGALMTHHFSIILMYLFVTLDKQAEVAVYRQLMGRN